MGSPCEVETIFVGGGTPTRLDPPLLSRLMEIVGRWFPLAPGGEWTVEANPGTLDERKCDIMAEAGVGRISLGAQSFHAPSLKVLERQHDPDDIPRALEWVRPRFPQWSLDLIFGVPGSTPDDWSRDLRHALNLGPAHLSCYGLIFEKGTALWKSREAGQVRPIDEDFEYAMYADTIATLDRAGLGQYEISNFARPGHECRHNLVYWANDAYHGFGLGAARYLDGTRATNTRDLMAYLRRIERGEPAIGPKETLDPEGRARETAVLMLRRTQLGLGRDDFRMRTGYDIDTLAGDAIPLHVAGGLLDDDGRRIKLTPEGIFVADTVLCDFLA